MLETQALKNFSITSWYSKFKHVALETIIVKIPPELLQRLQSGELNIDIKEVCSDDYLNNIKNIIQGFKEGVFVKNNWHAPMDARCFSFGNSLQVTCVDDIFLYLTASDVLVNDFNSDVDVEFCIALKPFLNIHPASEFRCIVINGVLRGITPRDFLTFYPHFMEEGTQILDEIREFFEQYIRHKFLQTTYTFDLIISHTNEVKLIDFGVLNNKTKLYAFKWPEIQAIIRKNCSEEVAPVFRYLESDIGIMSNVEAMSRFVNSN